MLYKILILMSFDQRLSLYRDLYFPYQLNTILRFFNFIIWIGNRRSHMIIFNNWFSPCSLLEINPVDFNITIHGILRCRFGAASPNHCDCILSSQLHAAWIELRRDKHHLLVWPIWVSRYQQSRLAVVSH